jgi:Zn-dependent protease/CBS domain-containing protein
MRQTIRLGRVAGVPVGLNGGALVLLVLLAAALAFGRLPFVEPGRGWPVYALAGLVTAVLFLACLLVHELAHVVVARANGIHVDGVTLWLLGGVAQLRDEPRTPGAEFAVAVVGPATSLVLGGAFGGLAAGLLAVHADPLLVGTAVYLGAVNVLLAAFNLVPAAPLDGGRVLRAAVWRWTGDRVRGGVVAARAGRAFGVLLIAFGFGTVLLGAGFGGLWWALLGWFLVHAAAAEEARAVTGRRLSGVRVADVMSARPVTVDPDLPVDAFVDEVAMLHRFSTYPLVDGDGRLTGLVTLNRLRAVPPHQRSSTRLREVACPPDRVPVARPDEPLLDLLPRLDGCADGRAVVVDGTGRVVGLVSPSDVSAAVAVADLRGSGPYALLGADLNAAGDRREDRGEDRRVAGTRTG